LKARKTVSHPDGTRFVPGSYGSVLTLSMRRLSRVVAYCLTYEFEDVIAETTGADRVDAGNQELLDLSRRMYRIGRTLTGSPRFARGFAPRPSTVALNRDYDLFLPIVNEPYELFALATIPDWRKRCRKAACFVNEPYIHLLPDYLLEMLHEFDHIFVGSSHVVDQVARIVGRPCSQVVIAADVARFAPLPNMPPRTIDVCNIGRRSDVTHAALIEEARQRRMFYYYDTVAATGFNMKQRTFTVQDAGEHRLMLANMLQRSRYYVANRGRINEPEFTQGRDEISGRFFEGAAAGCVMLGEAPRTEEFRQLFDWPDAVIHFPWDSPDAARFVRELDEDPERLARIRALNVHHSALRHDWVQRLRTVYETLGIAPTEGMLARERRLRLLAAMALEAPMEDAPRARQEPCAAGATSAALQQLDPGARLSIVKAYAAS